MHATRYVWNANESIRQFAGWKNFDDCFFSSFLLQVKQTACQNNEIVRARAFTTPFGCNKFRVHTSSNKWNNNGGEMRRFIELTSWQWLKNSALPNQLMYQ